MEIGVSTATMFLRMYSEEALPFLDSIDSRVCEVFLGTFSEYTRDFAKILKSRLGNLKVHSIHTLNTHFEPQLFSVNPRAEQDALKIYEDVLFVGQTIGAKNYTMHGSARLKRGAIFNKFESYGKHFCKLCELGEKYGINLTLENVEWAFYNYVGFFAEMKKYCPKLKACLDIKQAEISGFDYRDYLDEMGENINTVHLSDRNAEGKICLPGRGKFDFKELFERLSEKNFNGNMLIEVYNDSFQKLEEIVESLDYLRNIKSEVFGK